MPMRAVQALRNLGLIEIHGAASGGTATRDYCILVTPAYLQGFADYGVDDDAPRSPATRVARDPLPGSPAIPHLGRPQSPTWVARNPPTRVARNPPPGSPAIQ
jgi:hypothetical protein